MLKLVVVFRSYGLIPLLGPRGPNIVSKPQTPELQNVGTFHDFIESNIRFWTK